MNKEGFLNEYWSLNSRFAESLESVQGKQDNKGHIEA
jgi:hypothetical protein